VFGTRLTRITRELRVRDPDAALRRVAVKVVDWSGGTRIGASLHELNRRWVRRTVRSGAVVIVVSDGWERDDPAQLAREMATLSRSCHRLIWLDPLAGRPGFKPATQGLWAKLAVAEDGRTTGNVSGGCLEQDVREVALQVIQKAQPELRSYCSSADEIAAWDLGVGCEGQVDVLVELAGARPEERALLDGRRAFGICSLLPGKGERPGNGKRLVVTGVTAAGDLGWKDLNKVVAVKARGLLETGESGLHELAGRTVFIDVLIPPPQLIVLGAGDDARPLVRFAAEVGFRVVVVDRRSGLLTHERFPAAALLVESAGAELAEVLPL